MVISRRAFSSSVMTVLGLPKLLGAARPKLVVLVILEQFRPDYLDLAASQLTAGGFRRLVERGSYFPDCRNSASTFSASSIATLATGAWPAQHGIVADSWFETAAGRAVRANDEALSATTLAAQIAADDRNSVHVIAMQRDHAAIFAGSPNASLYWLDENGVFATNDESPDWIKDFNQQHSPDAVRNTKWVALGAKPDAAPLRVLNYDVAHPDQFLELYEGSPFGQDAQFDLLSELITREKLGQGSGTDFVCLVAGAMSLLGYETGGRSPLMQQMTLRLDRRIEALLNQLSRAPGDGNYSFAMCGGHGAPPLATEDERPRMRVNGEAVAQSVDKALAAHGLGRVRKYVYPFLYLDTDGFREPEELRLAAARAALQQSPVAGYFTAGGACSTQDAWRQRFANSFDDRRSGDVMLSYRPEYVEAYGEGRGISYGSLYNYDVRVPLFLFGPLFRTGVYENVVETVDVAPTLARIAGVAAPSSSVGRVLGESVME